MDKDGPVVVRKRNIAYSKKKKKKKKKLRGQLDKSW